MNVKKLVLAALVGFLGLGYQGEALAAGKSKAATRPTSDVRKAHSPAIQTSRGEKMLEFCVDVAIDNAEGKRCEVEVELCNAAGQPYLKYSGEVMKFSRIVTPDSDEYRASNLSFRMFLDDFWFFYGREAHDLTFKVTVRDLKSGKVLNRPAIMGVRGLTAVLPNAPTERTDNPMPKPRSVWMRLILG